jgi:hypothetical protein
MWTFHLLICSLIVSLTFAIGSLSPLPQFFSKLCVSQSCLKKMFISFLSVTVLSLSFQFSGTSLWDFDRNPPWSQSAIWPHFSVYVYIGDSCNSGEAFPIYYQHSCFIIIIVIIIFIFVDRHLCRWEFISGLRLACSSLTFIEQDLYVVLWYRKT